MAADRRLALIIKRRGLSINSSSAVKTVTGCPLPVPLCHADETGQENFRFADDRNNEASESQKEKKGSE